MGYKMAEKRMKTKPLKNLGELEKKEKWHCCERESTSMHDSFCPGHKMWVILTKRSCVIMSPVYERP